MVNQGSLEIFRSGRSHVDDGAELIRREEKEEPQLTRRDKKEEPHHMTIHFGFSIVFNVMKIK